MEPESLNELALFAGAGGGILGGKLLGWRTVCAVEIEPAARQVLLDRQDDGCLDPFPIWDDVTTFDGRPWCGLVDVVSGGFPCQDISNANAIWGKEKGFYNGERSGPGWGQMARIVGEVRPRLVFVENSPMLVGRGLGRVLSDLAAMGYVSRWGVVGADAAGLAHHRARLWLVAHSNRYGLQGWEELCDAQGWNLDAFRVQALVASDSRLPVSDPGAFRKRYGMARAVDRCRAIGNGQVPAVAATAWTVLQPAPGEFQ